MTPELNPDFIKDSIRAAMELGGGALHDALAKAQSEFPAIPRDKQVTVKTKTGGSYTFKYAPLDSILSAVRKPLADNGLALSQLLDGGDLVTMLVHKDGGSLVGRLPVPSVDGIQAFGSAITYLRRYSIQAILGIAAEEDDDANHAEGNATTFGGQTAADLNAQERDRLESIRPPADADSSADAPPDAKSKEVEEMMGRVKRRGIVRKGTADNFKLTDIPGPEGHQTGFRLEIDGDKNIPQCVVSGPLGDMLFMALGGKPEALLGNAATVAGLLYNVRRTDKPGSWYRLHVDMIETDDWILPAPDEPAEAPTAELFTGPEFEKPDAA